MKASRIVPELERKREELGMAQGQFANKELGVSRISYNHWINGASNPSQQTLADLYAYLRDVNEGTTTVMIDDGEETRFFKSSEDTEGTVSAMQKAEAIEG